MLYMTECLINEIYMGEMVVPMRTFLALRETFLLVAKMVGLGVILYYEVGKRWN